MLHLLKMSGKRLALFALSCTLLLAGLLSWQLHTPVAHAAGPFDVYVFTPHTVWGHNGASATEIDNGNIGVNGNVGGEGVLPPIAGVVSMGGDIFELRSLAVGGAQTFIYQLALGGCPFNGFGTGWCLTELDDNAATIQIAAGGNGHLYQVHSTGSIWQATGMCFHCWTELDDNHLSFDIVAGVGKLFQIHTDGSLWKYTGCGFHCWEEIDTSPGEPFNMATSMTLDTTGTLYELRDVFDSQFNLLSTTVSQGFGPFNWQTIDNTDLTSEVLANTRLYQRTNNGALRIYDGGLNNWFTLPSDPGGFIYTTGQNGNSDALYSLHTNYSVWEYTPESNQWVLISAPVSCCVLLSQPRTPGL